MLRTKTICRSLSSSTLAAFAALGAACESADPATELSAEQESLAFRGTDVEMIDVVANGAWTAETAPAWISTNPSSGVGDDRIRVTIDRDSLSVGEHSGTVTLNGDTGVSVTVPIVSRFPRISGEVRASDGHLTTEAQALAANPSPADAPHFEGEMVVRLDRRVVALREHGTLSAEPSVQTMRLTASRLGERVGAQRTQLLSAEMGFATMKVDGPVGPAIEALEQEGQVLYAEPNYIYQPTAVDDPGYATQWHYQNIKLEQAWEVTQGYEDVIVAVIDGDFHPDHPDLADNLLPGWDFVRDTDDFYTFNEGCGGHGSHTSGTVAAVTNNSRGVAGVAPNVRVIPMNVARRPEDEDPEFPGCQLDSAAIVRAILYAAGLADNAAGSIDRPVDVINMSLGGGAKSEATADALAFARDEGVIAVASAGNSGPPTGSDSSVGFPGALNSTIAVSATDQFDEMAPYSSRGPEVWVAAPGGNVQQDLDGVEEDPPPAGVLSTVWNYNPEEGNPDHGYAYFQGTSMSSPHIAGVVALMRTVNPHLDTGEASLILAETAVDLGDEGRDVDYGHGLVDAAAAVSAARGDLEIPARDVVVRIMDGDTVVAETYADAQGGFSIEQVPAGDYTIVAGDLRQGRIGVPGTLFGERSLKVVYEGDMQAIIDMTPQ